MRTKFANKTANALGLLVMVMCIISPTVSAIDYSPIEDFFETVLVDPQLGLNIQTASIAIGTSQVVIEYTTSASSFMEVGDGIAGVVMVYKAIVDDYPEVGNLLILAKSKFGDTPTRFTCQKSWVSGLDGNDEAAIGAVVGKVIETDNID